MAGKSQTIVSLDPIDRRNKRDKGLIGRFLITRYGKGKPIKKMLPFGHYMFCGSQGSGKTSSAIWYAEKLALRYMKKKRPVKLYSNLGVGESFDKKKLFELINNFEPDNKEIRIVIIDEIHTYFPRGSVDKETAKLRDDLVAIFSQLRKRSTFI